MSFETSLSDHWKNLDNYLALPRIGSLVLAPNSQVLVASVALINESGTEYTQQLFAIDPAGVAPARQLTHQSEGASNPVFTANGDLLFTSSRAGQTRDGGNDEGEKQSRIFRLTAGSNGLPGGEAEEVYTRAGAISTLLAAAKADTVVAAVNVMPGADTDQQDNDYLKLRKEAKVNAIYHSSYPIRFWDQDIGPDYPRFAVLEEAQAQESPEDDDSAKSPDAAETSALKHSFTAERVYTRNNLSLRLLGDQGAAAKRAPLLSTESAHISEDGSNIVYSVGRATGHFDQHSAVEIMDATTGEVRTLLEPDGYDYAAGLFSPDGAYVAVNRYIHTSSEQPREQDLGIVEVATGQLRMLSNRAQRWFDVVGWSRNGKQLYATADDGGRHRLFRIDVATGHFQVLADDPHGSFIEINVGTADSGTEMLYGLRAGIDAPPTAVRIDPASSAVMPLQNPVGTVLEGVPGSLTEVFTEADDGVPLRAWLVLPEGASAENPAPLLTFIHGGPVMSWNMWSWRWNPYLLAAHGYAVLLPDPALSTGYGPDFVARGWDSWGQRPYTDLMTMVDETLKRSDIDPTKTAALGGSFGGYMANWIAGKTDRFDAIVTHASLWALDQFGPTTDAAYFWEREFSAAGTAVNSPHNNVENINTPMLVIHGDKDYRVPIGEGLRLWWELNTKSQLPADGAQTVHRFLYFPEENHWILSPQHSKIWYQTVTAFLSEHVLGIKQDLPETLGGVAHE